MAELIEQYGLWAVLIFSLAINLKEYIPKWIGSFVRRGEDQQEHQQELDKQKQTYEILQSSWREDRLANLLDEDQAFVREQVHSALAEILAEQRTQKIAISKINDRLNLLGQQAGKGDEDRKLLRLATDRINERMSQMVSLMELIKTMGK